MPFQVSPGVNVSEIDLTTIVPAVSTTFGGTAGVFQWGPVEDRVLVSTEDELVSVFGKPNSNTYESFLNSANFLAYGNQLYVVRASSNAFNAYANTGFTGNSTYTTDVRTSTTGASKLVIKNDVNFQSQQATLATTPYANVAFIAKYPGIMGNSLEISVCSTANAYSNTVTTLTSNSAVSAGNSEVYFTLALGANTANVWIQDIVNTGFSAIISSHITTQLAVGDKLLVGNTTTGTQYLTISEIGSRTDASSGAGQTSQFNIKFQENFNQRTSINITTYANTTNSSTLATRYWKYFNLVDSAPGISNYVASRNANTAVRDEMHIVVVDANGKFSGVPGQVLEVWRNVSRATDAKGEQGGSIYYRDVLNNRSRYVWSSYDYFSSKLSDDTTLGISPRSTNLTYTFSGGTDGSSESDISVAALATAYDKFKSAEDVDVSLILGGKAKGNIGETLANYIIDNICEYRRDCVAFISPDINDTVNVPLRELDNLVEFRNALRSTSYAVLDSGYKYQYDKYNDTYRWVPLNGDIAGLCVRTDNTRDPWYSPAGFNRGQIKNIVKLSYNPDKADRDVLYRNGINPVVNFQGQGTVLYGDKTLLARPSAFDRINVRRLFIVLEKAIANAAQSTLFEFNDEFTRAAFRNLVEPYLRDVQGRRGIYDFRVVCDTTNNTPEVIDRNEFRGDIYIKPARSINFIQLNFVAVRTGVEFEEIVGRF
jgi:phage tail sheath protein FI